MFVDRAKIYIKAGDGGDGAVSFRREKFVANGGPDGGDGGKGGDIIFKVDGGLNTLMDFRYKRKYVSEDGGKGTGRNSSGKNGKSLIVTVPPGTLIIDENDNKTIADLVENGQEAVIARGGKGGKGNQHFATPTRQVPNFAEEGIAGEEKNIILELKLLADVGIIGFPNVGKSTILSMVTAAKPEIGDYHFTTITPHPGVVFLGEGRSFVLVDIPGLIEGASSGAGLGHYFLRHIERTRLFVHVVDISGFEGRNPIEDFEKINKEIGLHDERLLDVPQVIVANKIDLLEDYSEFENFKNILEGKGYKVFGISAATNNGLHEVMEYTYNLLQSIPKESLINFDEEIMYKDSLENTNEPMYYIDVDQKENIKEYTVYGRFIDNLTRRVNFADIESVQYFQRRLRQKGVFERLEEMGIEDGDIVKVNKLEFEYYK